MLWQDAQVRILHLASEGTWRQARAIGDYRGSTRGADLDQVGYVHASTADQLPSVIQAVYADDNLDEQRLLVIDVPTCEAAGSPVRWEIPEDGEHPFPHVYGPIPVQAVVAVFEVTRRNDGTVSLPDLTDLDVFSEPPRSGGSLTR